MKIAVYGIKNCDTMKKALAWLDRREVAYAFHDYKKDGADPDVLKRAIAELGWENVINRKGATWRGLPENIRQGMNATNALKAALENPSLIKRPLIVRGKSFHLGFDEEAYKKIFSQ